MEFILSNIPLTCTLVGVAGVVFAIIIATMVKAHQRVMKECRKLLMQSKKAQSLI